MHRFKKLEMWRLSRAFCSDIYSTTGLFPDHEKFGLTNQLRRASVSIPLNIAEGSSRNSNKDFSRFIEIAVGSAYEIETQLLIALDLEFITEDNLRILIDKLNVIIKMMLKFRNSLKV